MGSLKGSFLCHLCFAMIKLNVWAHGLAQGFFFMSSVLCNDKAEKSDAGLFSGLYPEYKYVC